MGGVKCPRGQLPRAILLQLQQQFSYKILWGFMLLICEAAKSQLAAAPLLNTIKAGFSVAQRLANMLSHGPLQSNKSVPDRHPGMELEPSNAATETQVILKHQRFIQYRVS